MRKRRNRTPKKKEVSELGKMIDMPLDNFKASLTMQKVPIGVINQYILLFEATYAELRGRKDAVLDLVFKGEKTKDEVKPVVDGLYAEMTKLEQKIVYMKERVKELLNLGD